LLTRLLSHPLNSNELNDVYLDKLQKNIAETGNYPALIVRPMGDNYQIIDGHHRMIVLKELGYKTAKCEVWDVDDKQVLVLLSTLNRLRGADDIEKRSTLLHELVDVYPNADFMDWIPESPSAISSLLQSIDGDVEKTLEIEQGLIEETLIMNNVDPDKAKHIANSYHPPAINKIIKFVFYSQRDYNKVMKKFDGKPTVRKLIALLDTYGK